MSLNAQIIDALSRFGLQVVPGVYIGEDTEYYTFNYDEIPTQFAGDVPIYYKILVQVHYIAPLTTNTLKRRRDTVRALVDGGFTWPEVIDASDKDTQHFVFECETIRGVDEE